MFHIPASERDTGTEIIHTPEERRVEDFDCDDDGGIAMATFSIQRAVRGGAGSLVCKAAWWAAASRLM